MTNSRRAASLAAVLTFALVTLTALGTVRAHAQTAPFTAYGSGLTAGATVTAIVKAKTCATATVDSSGNWLMQISSTSPCNPTEGDEISFELNGQPTDATETYRPGGAPTDIANGITLEAAPDTKPPVVTAPAAITVSVAEGAAGAPATTAKIASFLGAATATDAVDGTVAVTNDAPVTFPIGATTVTFTATDKAGNSASATSTVTVRESGGVGTFQTPPSGTGVSTALWNGGSVDQLVEAAGDGAESIWVYDGGKAIGYTVGAPAFVNAAFLALFPSEEVPSGQILILVLG